MKLTWFGTASIALETEKTALLFDPFLPLSGSSAPIKKEDFEPYHNILITHGHFDHIGSMLEICHNTGKRVYATKGACKNMMRLGLNDMRMREIVPGKSFRIGDFRITPYQGKHVKFDRQLLKDTLWNPRMIGYGGNLPGIMTSMIRFPEKAETVGYLVEAEGKSVFLLGSLNLHEEVAYPRDMDYLVLPYQGRSDILDQATWVMEVLQPHCVILDHFDDTFPPISSRVDTTTLHENPICRQDGVDVPILELGYKEPYDL